VVRDPYVGAARGDPLPVGLGRVDDLALAVGEVAGDVGVRARDGGDAELCDPRHRVEEEDQARQVERAGCAEVDVRVAAATDSGREMGVELADEGRL
jgi:hypothetical protein